MSYYTVTKRDTVVTDGSGQEKEIAPVQSNYTSGSIFPLFTSNYTGKSKTSASTGATGSGKSNYTGGNWLSNAVSSVIGAVTNPDNWKKAWDTGKKIVQGVQDFVSTPLSEKVNTNEPLVGETVTGDQKNYTQTLVSAPPETDEGGGNVGNNGSDATSSGAPMTDGENGASGESNYTGTGNADGGSDGSNYTGSPETGGDGNGESGDGNGSGGSNYTGGNTAYKESIEAKRQSAYTEAEKERQRAIVDAHNAHEFNKSNYGAKAEALGNMGLTGSGYSDYMNSSAYANSRGEIQKANAQSAYTKRVADEAAAQEQSAYESARTDKYNAILSNIGSYDTEQINGLVSENGFTPEQAAALISARSEWETEQSNKEAEENKDTFTEVLLGASSGKYTESDIDHFATMHGYDKTQVKQLKNARTEYVSGIQNENYAKNAGSFKSIDEIDNSEAAKYISAEQAEKERRDYYLDIIKGDKDQGRFPTDAYGNRAIPEFSIAEVEALKESGKLSEPSYDQIKQAYIDAAVTDVSAFFDEYNMSYYSKSEAEKMLKDYKDDKWLTPDQKKEIQKAYDRRYTAVVISEGFIGHIQGTTTGGFNNYGSTGYNFEVGVYGDYNRTGNPSYKWQLEFGEPITDPYLQRELQNAVNGGKIKSNSVFVYGDSLYIYNEYNGAIYTVRDRTANAHGDKAEYGQSASLMNYILNQRGMK